MKFIDSEPFSYLTQNTLTFLENVFWSFPGTDIVQWGDLVQGPANGNSANTYGVFVFAKIMGYTGAADLTTDSIWDILVYGLRTIFIFDTKHTYLFPSVNVVQRGDLVQGPANGNSSSTSVFVMVHGGCGSNDEYCLEYVKTHTFWSYPETNIVQRGDLVQGPENGNSNYSTSTFGVVFLAKITWYIHGGCRSNDRFYLGYTILLY
jgi:hypothetical protein